MHFRDQVCGLLWRYTIARTWEIHVSPPFKWMEEKHKYVYPINIGYTCLKVYASHTTWDIFFVDKFRSHGERWRKNDVKTFNLWMLYRLKFVIFHFISRRSDEHKIFLWTSCCIDCHLFFSSKNKIKFAGCVGYQGLRLLISTHIKRVWSSLGSCNHRPPTNCSDVPMKPGRQLMQTVVSSYVSEAPCWPCEKMNYSRQKSIAVFATERFGQQANVSLSLYIRWSTSFVCCNAARESTIWLVTPCSTVTSQKNNRAYVWRSSFNAAMRVPNLLKFWRDAPAIRIWRGLFRGETRGSRSNVSIIRRFLVKIPLTHSK